MNLLNLLNLVNLLTHYILLMVSGKLPPRKIAPRSGSGFGLGLALELGLGAIFLVGNFPRTISDGKFFRWSNN